MARGYCRRCEVKVLVACEFSGVVRDAFAARGHNAISIDLLPTESSSFNHITGDVLDYINAGYGWDLMIAHPPCTFLANSGNKHLYRDMKKQNGPDHERWVGMAEAAHFFWRLLNAPIEKICMENPVMHGYGQTYIGQKPTQTIQPWQFGHGEIKATCLWLKNLPPLFPTDIVEGREARVHREPPGEDRWKERSRTLPGIAKAMAEQWG